LSKRMKKNSIQYLEKMVERKVRKYLPSLKMYRYRDRGLEDIVTRTVPTEHKDLLAVTETARWLITNAPEKYVYGEMIDVDNAIASNLQAYLLRYANNYLNRTVQ